MIHQYTGYSEVSDEFMSTRSLIYLHDDILHNILCKITLWRRLFRNRDSLQNFFRKNEIHELDTSIRERMSTQPVNHFHNCFCNIEVNLDIDRKITKIVLRAVISPFTKRPPKKSKSFRTISWKSTIRFFTYFPKSLTPESMHQLTSFDSLCPNLKQLARVDPLSILYFKTDSPVQSRKSTFSNQKWLQCTENWAGTKWWPSLIKSLP